MRCPQVVDGGVQVLVAGLELQRQIERLHRPPDPRPRTGGLLGIVDVSGPALTLPARTPGRGLDRAPGRAAPWDPRGPDLTGLPRPEVRGESAPWVAPLTRRHADILTRLHRAGPDGLSAGRLSRALYGDDQHVVTVRAEISRLRRAIGARVATNRYRLADGVTLEMTHG